ncbi:MAG: zinc metallopeptidase [Treponema sp.]|nr:zinc metallopeptidase [Treponema sp.]
MYYYGIDYTYMIFVLPALILSLWASAAVKSRFSKYDRVMTKRGITGAQAAAILLRANGISDVKIQHIRGNLTDNYNPVTKILSLSDATYSSSSIAAVGVAAHETGHAIQHNTAYFPLSFRRTLVPVANLGSRLGPLMAVAGIGFGYSGYADQNLPLFQLITDIGLLLFAGAILFYIVTLPVEFNASRRALKILRESGVFVDKEEIRGARSVLWAAAMTYVASALSAVGSFLRLLLITNSRRRRR